MEDREGHEVVAWLHDQPQLAPLFAALAGQTPSVVPDAGRIAVVGGAVRDLLLGRTPTDIDLVTEGSAAALAQRLGVPERLHSRFGTATVTLAGGNQVDVAAARCERYPQPGALPVVAPAKLEGDLARRDFSVNAIAVVLSDGRDGELLQVPGALADLHAQRLAVLHSASFHDDPTRLLRLVRYQTRLGFTIAPETAALARAALGDGALGTVSGDRLGRELRLLAAEPDPVRALSALAAPQLDHGLARAAGLTPAAAARFGLDVPTAAVLRSALTALPADGRADLLALAAMARRLTAAELRHLLDHLAFAAGERTTIIAAATRAAAVADRLESARRHSQLAVALQAEQAETVALAAGTGSAAAAASARLWLTDLRERKLAIDGNDLLAAGVPRGPGIGRGLQAARGAMLDDLAPDRASQLRLATQAAAVPDQNSS